MSVKVNITYVKKPTVLKARDVDLRVPDDGYRYVQTLHDFEYNDGDQYQNKPRQIAWNAPYDIPAQNNEVLLKASNDLRVPIEYRGRTYDYVRTWPAWQWWMFELYRASVLGSIPIGSFISSFPDPNPKRPYIYSRYTEGSALWLYANLMEVARQWTDAEPIEEGFYDAVTGRNPGKPVYKYLCKTNLGNIHRIFGEDSIWWTVEAIDLLKSLSNIYDVLSKPWLIHWATNQGVDQLPNGTYKVSRFPQVNRVSELNGYPDSGTPHPVLSWGGTIKVLKARTRILKGGQFYSPYNPAK